jgi:hypothetical protein
MSKVLEVLRATYGTMNIPAVAAGLEIGLAEKTTRNMLCEGRFPLKTKKISTKRVVSIMDLAAFLESDSGVQGFQVEKKRRGPRTKKSKIEAVRGEV